MIEIIVATEKKPNTRNERDAKTTAKKFFLFNSRAIAHAHKIATNKNKIAKNIFIQPPKNMTSHL